MPVRSIGRSRAVELQRSPLNRLQRAGKRAIDLAIAAPVLFMLSTAFALVALAIKIESQRPGLLPSGTAGSRRTTVPHLQVPFDARDRKRRQRGAGDAKRRARHPRRRVPAQDLLDELPQLINVILGDMSLVGPRPHALAHDKYYGELIGNYELRQHVKPGITGWAQVNGLRGETTDLAQMEARVAHSTSGTRKTPAFFSICKFSSARRSKCFAQGTPTDERAAESRCEFLSEASGKAVSRSHHRRYADRRLSRHAYATDLMVRRLPGGARRRPSNPKLVFTANGNSISLAASTPRYRKLVCARRPDPRRRPVGGARLALLTRTPIPERSATTDFIHDAAFAARARGLRFYHSGRDRRHQCCGATAMLERLSRPQIVRPAQWLFRAAKTKAAICDDINASRRRRGLGRAGCAAGTGLLPCATSAAA